MKLLAFNLAGMVRGEVEDTSEHGWDQKRVQQTVLKAGARVAKHGRRLMVDVAQAAGDLQTGDTRHGQIGQDNIKR